MSQSVRRLCFNVTAWKQTKNQWEMANACIQQDEVERIKGFCFKEDAKSAMVGRLLLRYAISLDCGIPWRDICLQRNDHGRPFCEEAKASGYDVNISHQGDWVALSAQRCPRIGVDCMALEMRGRGPDGLSEYFRLMRRQFTPGEWRYIESPATSRDMLSRFYRHWCLKESFVKAEGSGLTMNLQRIDFKCLTPVVDWPDGVAADTELRIDGVLQPRWVFEESWLDSQHRVAVAYEADENALRKVIPFKQITFDDLVACATPLDYGLSDRDLDQLWRDFDSKSERRKF